MQIGEAVLQIVAFASQLGRAVRVLLKLLDSLVELADEVGIIGEISFERGDLSLLVCVFGEKEVDLFLLQG